MRPLYQTATEGVMHPYWRRRPHMYRNYLISEHSNAVNEATKITRLDLVRKLGNLTKVALLK